MPMNQTRYRSKHITSIYIDCSGKSSYTLSDSKRTSLTTILADFLHNTYVEVMNDISDSFEFSIKKTFLLDSFYHSYEDYRSFIFLATSFITTELDINKCNDENINL